MFPLLVWGGAIGLYLLLFKFCVEHDKRAERKVMPRVDEESIERAMQGYISELEMDGLRMRALGTLTKAAKASPEVRAYMRFRDDFVSNNSSYSLACMLDCVSVLLGEELDALSLISGWNYEVKVPDRVAEKGNGHVRDCDKAHDPGHSDCSTRDERLATALKGALASKHEPECRGCGRKGNYYQDICGMCFGTDYVPDQVIDGTWDSAGNRWEEPE